MTLGAPVSFASRINQAMPNGDPGETTRALALAESVARSFAQEGIEVDPQHIATGAARAILGRKDVTNPYQYARECALRFHHGFLEDAMEAESESRFAEARQPVAPIPTQSTATELDMAARQMEEALARLPDVILSATQDRPETARRMIVDSALLLYRAAGEGAAHQIVRNGKAHFVAARQDDLPWLVREMQDWYRLVLDASAARAHGRRADTIPHPYAHLFDRLLAYRVQQGHVPERAPDKKPSRREQESGVSAW